MKYLLVSLGLIGLIGLPVLAVSNFDSEDTAFGEPIRTFFTASRPVSSQVDACKLGSNNDIGYLVNQADRILGENAGEILVPCNGPIRTQIILSEFHTLKFGPGTFRSELKVPAILINDNTVIQGSGWNTVLIESVDSDEISHIIIQSFKDASNHYNQGAKNVILKDFKILGNTLSKLNSVVQAITLGNAKNVHISNVYIDGTRAMGIGVGGTNGTGNSADGIWVTDCLFERITSQNIAVVNARNLHIDNNVFLSGGQAGTPFFAYIDFETNVPNDVLENFTISNNIIDARKNPTFSNAILVQGQNVGGDYVGPGVISGNTIIGGDYSPVAVTNLVSNAIAVSRARDVLITGNNARRIGQMGLAAYDSTRITMSNNRLQNVGGGGVIAVAIYNTTYSQFTGNVLVAPKDNGSSSNGVVEYGVSDYNIYFNNIIGLLYETPGSYGIDQGFTLVGPNSKTLNNVIAGKVY